MALNLSDEQRAVLLNYLDKAEPYSEDAPEMNTLDGDEGDPDRVAATFAKKWLDQDDREKAARKQQG